MPIPSPNRARRRRPTRRTVVVTVLGMAVLAVVVAVIVSGVRLLTTATGGGEAVSLDPMLSELVPGPTPTPRASDDAISECREPAPQPVLDSGEAVIEALEHAYYVLRDAAAVRALAAPGVPFNTVEVIQSGIDTIPPGTRACLSIAGISPDEFSVQVTEIGPNQTEEKRSQRFSTVLVGDRFFVSAITKAGG